MAVIVFNLVAFRAQFPAFVDVPDATLQVYWDIATAYISAEDYGYLHGASRAQALNLMTAHLAALNAMIVNGQTPGLIQSTTIDKVSVALTPPPLKNLWQWWLSVTPYGVQLWALLSMFAVGGTYIGGSPEGSAFRRARGRFY